jgi:hypothetical protein
MWCAAALEDFDDDHAAAATGAWRMMVCRGAGCRIRVVMLYRRIHRRHGQAIGSLARDVGFAVGAGEQPVVTDAVEPLGRTWSRKRLMNSSGRELHRAKPRLPVAAVILVAKGDAALVESEQAAVRDGDAVSVTGEIGEHRLGPGEGRLGVDEPVLPFEGARCAANAPRRRRPSISPKNASRPAA